jgi:hypothetical protein
MSVTIDGLDAFKAALRELPKALTSEAAEIVERAASDASSAIRTAYAAHTHTGNLAQHVQMRKRAGSQYGVSMEVRSTARHALLFEIGTETIRYTRKGASRGRMPAANIFIPFARQHRKAMYTALAAMMRTHGLDVTER